MFDAKRKQNSAKTRSKHQPRDRGANYNAFRRDPDGRLAFMAAFFWGCAYVPEYTRQKFKGPPEPPRFGPPAQYQMACLPQGWVPRAPPNFYGDEEALEGPYLDPPTGIFDLAIFDALKHIERFQLGQHHWLNFN